MGNTLTGDNKKKWIPRTSGTRWTENLYREHSDALYAYGRKLGAQAPVIEDAIHDIFVSFWEQDKRKEINNPKAYLFGALRNRLMKSYRKSALTVYGKDFESHNFPLEIDYESVIISEEIKAETLQRLSSGIASLSDSQREILYLRFNEGLEYNEIAETLNMNYQSALNAVHRAIKSLRTHLGETVSVWIILQQGLQ
ncbi:DNA-directed RNA polymerase sigma-70 factor [Fulvitalea axinellae]|uniref:DNA-directed RNA polymerase sigma-70 factor n=1 Tax=Fulvitalea axinellae TaxID=1182444 RepID=A0AAU9CMG4_9BACT|nr:DNA-directed RNA polymerase sigma-70 factor [Fulvitalea axinellae]